MAMYEIMFRRSDRADDVVITNADPRAERPVLIHGERWEVVESESAQGEIEARFTVTVVSTDA